MSAPDDTRDFVRVLTGDPDMVIGQSGFVRHVVDKHCELLDEARTAARRERADEVARLEAEVARLKAWVTTELPPHKAVAMAAIAELRRRAEEAEAKAAKYAGLLECAGCGGALLGPLKCASCLQR